jgi:poly-gamma-glutamate synthase PgsB/CapB
MLILARRGQAAQELFLYRAYDKATIWEQAKVVRYAQQMEAQVFLWECMALQPEFVNILNRHWMKDPVTTITNAYPDHEDVMGPSGEDVARVVGSFIPREGTVLSSEYQMAPVVRAVARESQARLIEIHTLESELLPEDLVVRFPYQEHPMNIALVLRLAEELGIDRERALVDIGDHVVPDLGVLKTFSQFQHRARLVQFSNGMSANERAGFLSNWKRLGFAVHDPDERVNTWNVALVNNRADRVPRSRVFAELLATDASVDAIVIIGTNQEGMRGFLHDAAQSDEALSRFIPDSVEDAPTSIERMCRHLNIPKALLTITARLRSVAVAVSGEQHVPGYDELVAVLGQFEGGPTSDFDLKRASAGFVTSLLSAEMPLQTPLSLFWTHHLGAEERRADLEAYIRAIVEPWLRRQQLLAAARAPGITLKQIVARQKETYAQVVVSRIFVLSQTYATGDQVIDFIVENSPPGLQIRLLGCQNIKGTGLDFVYRCISVDRVQTWLKRINEEPLQREESFNQLAAYADYGVIDARLALEFVAEALESSSSPHDSARLQTMKRELESKHLTLLTKLGGSQRVALWARMLGVIEPVFDHLDSVRRRRRADLAMSQFIKGKTSLSATVIDLRDVVARQKGGWLAKDVAQWLKLK